MTLDYGNCGILGLGDRADIYASSTLYVTV